MFVSYSHRDADYVNRLTAYLRAAGFAIWTDEGIEYGEAWKHQITTHIETCGAFLVVMSPHARAAPWVGREIESSAQEIGKPIVPLLLNGRRFLELRDLQDNATYRASAFQTKGSWAGSND